MRGAQRAPVEVQVMLRNGTGHSVSTWRYDPADPLAVRIDFPPNPGDDGGHQWTFARDLLADGLHGPVGEGDVRVSPVGDEVRIELTGEDYDPSAEAWVAALQAGTRPMETCPLMVSRERLVYFLRRTYGLVPRGREVTTQAVDDLIARCLGGVS